MRWRVADGEDVRAPRDSPAGRPLDMAADRGVLRAISASVREARTRSDGRRFVGVFKPGGLGDLLVAAAFARACKRRWKDAFVCIVCSHLGMDGDRGLAESAVLDNEAVDYTVTIPRQYTMRDWRRLTALLSPLFDVFYEVQYAVRTYCWSEAADQRLADLSARPYEHFLAGFPWTNAELDDMRQNQWEMMAASSGIAVTQGDLWISVACRAGYAPMKRTITVHHGAGNGSTAKCAAMQTMRDLVVGLTHAGYEVVQVGGPSDPLIDGVFDQRGLLLNQTAWIMRTAEMHVDSEGGLVYVAAAVGTRSLVFFGPTPSTLFGMDGNINITRNVCRPCWWTEPRWGVMCKKRPADMLCANIVRDGYGVAARVAAEIGQARAGNKE